MSEPANPLRKDVFLALAAVAWADGRLDPDEADAIVRAAVDEGLTLEEIAAIEGATHTPIDLGVVDRTGLSKEDRVFVYAIACWIAQLDGRVTPEERDALAKLGERLGIPERPRASAEAAVREVAERPQGDRPARYDLQGLRSLIASRLGSAPGAGASRS